MTTFEGSSDQNGDVVPFPQVRRLRRRRALLATVAALSLGAHDAAWAMCADGSTVLQNGFVVGQPPLSGGASSWSATVFTGTAGSVSVPVSFTNEFNDPNGPLTRGGHNWVLDQGSTLCTLNDQGHSDAESTGWSTPPNTPTFSGMLPTIKGGLLSLRLDNICSRGIGGDADKTASVQDRYSATPERQQLTSATVSPEGPFAIATSNKRQTVVYACLNPSGDPGNPNFLVSPTGTVQCVQGGSHALQTDLATEFGPDNQPYLGGQRVANSFNALPGATFRATWPNCIWIWQNNDSPNKAYAVNFKRQRYCRQIPVADDLLGLVWHRISWTGSLEQAPSL